MVSRGILRFASLLSGSRVPNALPARAPIFLAAAYRGERVVRNTNLLLCAVFGTDLLRVPHRRISWKKCYILIKTVGGCKTLENIHGQRADQSPKESGMCNKDKTETLWRLWGCEVNLNIFIRPSGGSYNTRSEMHALYTTFTLFFVASYGTNPCLRAFSNISLVTPAIKRSPVA